MGTTYQQAEELREWYSGDMPHPSPGGEIEADPMVTALALDYMAAVAALEEVRLYAGHLMASSTRERRGAGEALLYMTEGKAFAARGRR